MAVPEPTESSIRPMNRRFVFLLRRLHLYTGLLMLPWAVLYGVTAFLFNHPSLFSDAPTVTFGSESLKGTELEDRPGADELADQVVTNLNMLRNPGEPYQRIGPARWTREFSFATVTTEFETISVLIDVRSGSGTIRSQSRKIMPSEQPLPSFATGFKKTALIAPDVNKPKPEQILLDRPFQDRFRNSLPIILERSGFPTGTITVTSVPDLQFPIRADGSDWEAIYHSMTGQVRGMVPADATKENLSTRRFLLRLHTAHGYPEMIGPRWTWALIVDAMAIVLCFWGLSGLVMWWQIKSTRRTGFVLLIVSGCAAVTLAYQMHGVFSG